MYLMGFYNLFVFQDLHEVGKLLITTTSLLPRPRSESCFSAMTGASDQPNADFANTDCDDSSNPFLDKRSPKKLNLPINPLKKLHSSNDKSESKTHAKTQRQGYNSVLYNI